MHYAYLALALYFILMLAIGWFAHQQRQQTMSAYLLGDRQLSPAVTALSAGASDMSGWILMGLPGAVLLSGISATWIGIGLVLGALANYLWVAPRLRAFTEVANNALTLPEYFAERFLQHTSLLRLVSAVVIVLFFTIYTASGLVAGGKLFASAFHGDYQLGIILTLSVVVLYTFIGGFLAVSLTDFVQGILMFFALLLVPTLTYFMLSAETLQATPSVYFQWFNDATDGSNLTLLAIVSLLTWGLGYFGQPHILVRFMAIRSVADMPMARKIGMAWMIISLIGACLTGLFGAMYLRQENMSGIDSETIFIFLSQTLFIDFIAGLLLAAILAAIMSTISSQLLVTSSSLISDIYHTVFRQQASEQELVLMSRIAVVLVGLIAAGIAMSNNQSILALVSHAWAGFGAAFGPVIIASLYLPHLNARAALAGIISGAVTIFVCIFVPINASGATVSNYVYEMLPGFLISSLVIMLFNRHQANDNVTTERVQRFAKMEQMLLK